jgi:peroxiredoxin
MTMGHSFKRALNLVLATGLCLLPWPVTPAMQALDTRLPAPDFALSDLDGNNYRLADLRGKVVMINFWATWCPPCRGELPSLQRLWRQYQDEEFLLLAISVDENPDELSRFVEQFGKGLTFPILTDPSLSAARYWPLKGLPATFVIDKRGKVTHIVHGPRQWDSPVIYELLAPLLNES